MGAKKLNKKEYLERLVIQTLAVSQLAGTAAGEVIKNAIEGAYDKGVQSTKK